MAGLTEPEAPIPDDEMLVRLLQMGVVIEEYAEEKSAFMLRPSVDDDFTRDLLSDSLDESKEHRDILLELIDDIGGSDVDADEVEALVRDAVESSVEIDGASDPDEALREQLRSERLAYEFYDALLEACRESGNRIDGEKLDAVVSTLKEIREDEREDAEKIEEILNTR